ncbi:tetratricopeptide repeat protein [Diaminobutyricimonas sp. LJ205]|uniref:tetratricopeptide repeat protein n=1 Tax=Diaminobutyricimonas sp. LJ205 TaxID=2683590 RepID=UPI0012F4854C|nr:tetratricopeptide repeat protein [Diaminobutyricimonas sp. LJ205]
MLDQATLDALWDFDDPAGSERRFADAAAFAAAEDRAELLTQQARALGLQKQFGEADALLDTVEGVSSAARTRVLLERGRIRNSAMEPDAAVSLFRAAVDAACAAHLTFLAIDGYHMLAIADPERAEQRTRAGLADLRHATDDRTRRWAVALHNILGWHRHDAGRFEEALSEFQLALEAAEQYGTHDQVIFARWAVGRCLRSLGRTDEAIEVQRQLLRERPDDPDVAEELSLLKGSEPG